jgi:hypothetical protein
MHYLKTKPLAIFITVFMTLLNTASSSALAGRNQDIESTLQQFQANPQRVMNQHLQKFYGSFDTQARPLQRPEPKFRPQDIRSGNFILQRDHYRQRMCTIVNGARICMKDIYPGRAPIEHGDLVQNLVDNGARAIKNPTEMERLKLTTAKLQESPWSDDYWPIYKGVTAARYADPEFPGSEDWETNKNYVSKSPINPNIMFDRPSTDRHNVSSIDLLSPAEKYDLLVGDRNGTLTQAMWRQGEEYYRSTGKVETWMGICHGWAPASYMLPRPTSAVTVTSADGRTKIKFFPSDIKALSSLLWAQTETPSKMSGGRCNDKSPRQEANGRVISQECFDNNPGTWHATVVNQIGVSKRSFVIDATYDYEVWNQPMYGYGYTYFNPQTNKSTNKLQEAIVSISDFKADKFKNHRSPDARSIVGIAMDVSYVVETSPSHVLTDNAKNDAIRTVRYLYDLELDAKGNIIGGEWYTNEHPDFLWTPPANTRVASLGDRLTQGSWNGLAPLPKEWTRAAVGAAQYGQPLAKIVETLGAISRIQQR